MSLITRFRPAVIASTLVLAVAAFGLSACSSDAKSEGDNEITLYSGRSEELIKPLIEQFEDETGIKVNIRSGETAAMAAQILEEGKKSKADVFLAQDAGALGAVNKKDLFGELPSSVTTKVAEQYRGKDNKWVGVTGRARVIAYNPSKVSEEELPNSIYDLTDPKWKGRVAIAPTNASFQAFVTAIRVKDGDDKAEQFLADLAANEVQIREKNGIILDDVDAGTVDLGLINHYYWYEKQAEVGEGNVTAKLHFVGNGDPGALVNVSGVGVLKDSVSDPDTRRFVEYLVSKKGQQYFAEKTFEYPLTDEVSPAAGLPTVEQLDPPSLDLDDLNSLETTIRMISDSGLSS